MATSVQLAEKLAQIFNARTSTCSNTYKHLQAANLVSKGGRGRHAVPVSASDCVMLVLALLGSEHINDGPEAARRYSSLVAKYRDCAGRLADDRNENDARWYAMGSVFPALSKLDAGHTLLQAVAALVESFSSAIDPSIEPSIAVIIRGPEISALIRFSHFDGSEEITYYPANARDMFRTIIGNPGVQIDHSVMNVAGYLYVEKRITAKTLKVLGELLRDR